MSPPTWPDPAAAADLYRRLVAGDPVATADFATATLDPLAAFLAARYPWADDHLRVQAAGDAVLSVVQHPAVYDPARGDLPKFLRLAARRDLLNALAKERRHARRRVGTDPVELAAPAGNDDGDDLPSLAHPAVAAAIARFTAPERRVLDLMRAGERRTGAFAAALGLGHLPAAEQRRAVKRVKDKLLRRLERAAGGP